MTGIFFRDNQNENIIDKCFYLWTLLARARDAIHKAREISLKKFDITPEQFLILKLIKDIVAKGEKPTPSEIARRTFRNPNTISINARRMVTRRLVTKKQDKTNKKLTILSLTQEGEDIYEVVRDKEVTTRIMSSLNQEQKTQFISCLNTIIVAAINEIGKREYERIINSINLEYSLINKMED
jgi:DNA-binding MarR family transcriptional regulator